MADNKYDIIVLGAGPGGYVAALKAAQLGAKVAVVEKGDLGGTCLNFGCIPSKALLATAELIHSIEHAGDMGVKVGGKVSLDWSFIQKRKDKVLATLRGGIASLFKARKIDHLNGMGKLAGPNKVAVATADGKTKELGYDKLVLAVGSVPSRIPGWPTDPELVCTSDESLHWPKLPKKLLIVGGGVIGCEFACMMQPMGVEVTLVEMMPRLLPEMDEDLAAELAKEFKGRGIAVHTGVKVAELKAEGKGAVATLDNGQSISVDKVLVATGRRPATTDIGLETIGLETDRGFVRVNDRMETAISGVYCIGDANGRCLLAHAASAHGVCAAENAMGRGKPFDAAIPWAVYTFPEIAGVGMTDRQARDKGLPIAVGMFPIGHLGKAIAAGHTEGFVKTIRHRETGALLGVHMLGYKATEIIGAAGAMLDTNADVHALADVVFAHPTVSEALKESAEDSLGIALHLPPRKILKAVATVG